MRHLLPAVALALPLAACGGDPVPEVAPGSPEVPPSVSEPILPLPPGLELGAPAQPSPSPGPGVSPTPAPPPSDAQDLARFGDGDVRAFVLGAGLQYDSPDFQGVVVSCSPEAVLATVAHGLFPPPGPPVQTAVDAPGRDLERFGPPRTPPPAAAPHEARLDDPADVERLVESVFVPGALVTNGHRTFRVAPDPADLERMREDLQACLSALPDPVP